MYPATLQRYAVPYEAKIWVWQFFGNDLHESTEAEIVIAASDLDFKTQVLGSFQKTIDRPFPYNMRTFQLIFSILNSEAFIWSDEGILNSVVNENIVLPTTGAWQETDPTRSDVQRGWELTESALVEAHKLALSNDVKLAVIFVPYREHVYWEYIRDDVNGYDVKMLDEEAAKLESICTENGILFINLVPGFTKQALAGERLYYQIDGHWNEAGHDLAAEIRYEKLVQEGLISEY